MVTEQEAIENLAAAIILKAVQDYRQAAWTAKRAKYAKFRVEAIWEMQRIEDFIRSQWFGVLSDLCPEELIKRLREERL